MSNFNRKRYKLKEGIANKVNKLFEDVMDNQVVYSDKEIDLIVENIINAGINSGYLEPFNRNVVPLGKNDNKTRELYYRRRYYNEHAFPIPTPDQDIFTPQVEDDLLGYQGISRKVFGPFNYIDLNHKKIFYGRIDTHNRSIYPSEKFLRLVSGTNDVFLLNFVCEAASDMMAKIERLKSSGKLSNESAYYDFVPVTGWVSFLKDHHNTMKSVYDAFIVKYVNDPVLFSKIASFDAFSAHFVSFLNGFLPKFPITRSNMQLRRNTNPRMSGIVFEISREKHDDDKKKYTDYILDKHFLLIQNIANGFGFMVDKNAPWRFIADLESPQMRSRMAEKGCDTLQIMFDKYYYRSHLYEVDTLRKQFVAFYDSYVETYPCYTKMCVSKAGSKAKLLYRQKRNKNPFTDRKLLEYYYYVRAKESNKDWSQEQFNQEFETAHEVFKYYGFVEALNFINDKTTLIVGDGANYGNIIKKDEGKRIISNHQPSYKRSNFSIKI